MKRNKGFTLIELIAVIVVLAIISMLVFPAIIGVINNSKNQIHDEQIAELKKSARNWYIKNIGEIERGQDYCVSVAELIQTGYIDKTEVIDAKTNEPLDGFVYITYEEANKKYVYSYADTCDIDISGFKLRLMNTVFNKEGWAHTNVKIAVIGGRETRSYMYCKSTSGTCEPNTNVEESNGVIELENEGTNNYACAYGIQIDGSHTDTKCMGPYKIDKTSPNLTINGNLTFLSSERNLNLLQGLNYSDNLTPTDKINIDTNSTIKPGVVGEYTVNYKAIDQAGNSTTQSRKVTIELDDKDAPSITLSVQGSPFNNTGWAKEDIYISVSTDDSIGSGVASYTYCTTTSNTCTPQTRVNSGAGRIQISSNSETNKVCAFATDRAGNSSNPICVGPYKLDKIAPELSIPADSSIPMTQTSINLDTGVSYSDNLTANNNLVYRKDGSVTLRVIGTYPIKYSVTDEAGNTTTKTRIISVGDAEPPALTISNTGTFNANGWAKSNFVVNFSASDAGTGVKRIKYCTGNNCTPNETINSSNGSLTISTQNSDIRVCAIAEDNAGNTTQKQCVGPYKLDTTKPTVTLSATTDTISDAVTSYDLRTGYTLSDNLTSTADLNSSLQTIGTLSLGTPGTYTIKYRVTDKAGNVGEATKTITIQDHTKPQLEVHTTCTVQDETEYGYDVNETTSQEWCRGNVIMTLDADDATGITQYQYSTNGTSWSNLSGNTDTISTEGTTTRYYRVKDSAGNWSNSIPATAKIDKTIPTCSLSVAGTKNGEWYTTNAVVTFGSKSDDVTKYMITNSSTASYGTTSSYTVNYDTTGTTVYGYVKDRAGNVGQCTTTVKRDTVAPTCSLQIDTAASEGSWRNQNTQVSFNSKSDDVTSYNVTTSATASYGTTNSYTVTSNTNGGYVYGYVKDRAGNPGSCNIQVYMDKTTPNTPSASVSGSTITANSAGTDGPSGICWYSINDGSWQTSNTFTGLGNGNYTVKTRSCSGVASAASSQVTIAPTPSAVNTNSECGWTSGNCKSNFKIAIKEVSLNKVDGNDVYVTVKFNVKTGSGTYLNNSSSYKRWVCLSSNNDNNAKSSNCVSSKELVRGTGMTKDYSSESEAKKDWWGKSTDKTYTRTMKITNPDPNKKYSLTIYGSSDNAHCTGVVKQAIQIK